MFAPRLLPKRAREAYVGRGETSAHRLVREFVPHPQAPGLSPTIDAHANAFGTKIRRDATEQIPSGS